MRELRKTGKRLLLSEEECQFLQFLVDNRYIRQLREFETVDSFISCLRDLTKKSEINEHVSNKVIRSIQEFIENH